MLVPEKSDAIRQEAGYTVNCELVAAAEKKLVRGGDFRRVHRTARLLDRTSA